MKHSFLLLSLMFIISTGLFAHFTVSGILTYKNSINPWVMKNCPVYLISGTDTVAQGITNSTGHFEFTGILPGTYSVKVNSVYNYGGLSGGTDPLGVARHFIGLVTLDGLALKAADVTGEGHINAVDCLVMIKRFAGLIPDFKPPYVYPGMADWVFDDPSIVVDNSDVSVDINALCTGDVNGSYPNPN